MLVLATIRYSISDTKVLWLQLISWKYLRAYLVLAIKKALPYSWNGEKQIRSKNWNMTFKNHCFAYKVWFDSEKISMDFYSFSISLCKLFWSVPWQIVLSKSKILRIVLPEIKEVKSSEYKISIISDFYVQNFCKKYVSLESTDLFR